MKCQGTHIPNLTLDQVVQCATDIVDRNSTIDVWDTFHGMGRIATVKPKTKNSCKFPHIIVPIEDICSIGHVTVKYFNLAMKAIRLLSYHPLSEQSADDLTSAFDAASLFTASKTTRIIWSNAN